VCEIACRTTKAHISAKIGVMWRVIINPVSCENIKNIKLKSSKTVLLDRLEHCIGLDYRRTQIAGKHLSLIESRRFKTQQQELIGITLDQRITRPILFQEVCPQKS
jgi:hypothetical protein